jgi:hypothetical protein
LLFAALHVNWALGGELGLAASAGSVLAQSRPFWFVAGGLWAVAALLVIGAVIGVALACGDRRRTSGFGDRRLVNSLTRVAGWGATVLLAIRAVPTLVQDLLYQAGILSSARISVDDWSVIHWRLMLWTPWFLLGTALFAVALRQHRGQLATERDCT